MAEEITPIDALSVETVEADTSELEHLINNTEEVSQLLDSTLASINNTSKKNAFSDFEEDDEEFDDEAALEKRQSLLKILTLVRVFPDGQALKVAYIRDGLAKDMEPFTELIMSAMTSKFRGKHAAGAYSQSLIEAKEAELKEQFRLLEIEPTAEEKADARQFDEHYRSLV